MNAILLVNAEFPSGQMVCTRGVADLSEEDPEFAKFVQASVTRHFHKDWGDLGQEDKKANDEALKDGERILSAYNDPRFTGHGVASIWIITEGDRSVTTVLFPDEY